MQRSGRRVRTPHLVVLHQKNGDGATRFGLTVSRKVGNAVVRNRVKRWLREAIRRVHGHRVRGVDVVFIARHGAGDAGYEALLVEVSDAFRQVLQQRAAGSVA